VAERPEKQKDGVRLTRIHLWVWTCPYCDRVNRETDPPVDFVSCTNCGDTFKIGQRD
jgi:hypothetical protein